MGYAFIGLGIFLQLALLWYPALRYILFKRGIGPRRRGKLRAMNMIDWLNATGCGLFFGSVLATIGRVIVGGR